MPLPLNEGSFSVNENTVQLLHRSSSKGAHMHTTGYFYMEIDEALLVFGHFTALLTVTHFNTVTPGSHWVKSALKTDESK